MSAPSILDTVDPAKLAEATDCYAFAFMRASNQAYAAIVDDDSISPQAMVGGMALAYAFGLSAAIASLDTWPDADPAQEELLLQACIARIRKALAERPRRGTVRQ